eukprot:5398550-Pleurochrysis_carterae.AAC.5
MVHSSSRTPTPIPFCAIAFASPSGHRRLLRRLLWTRTHHRRPAPDQRVRARQLAVLVSWRGRLHRDVVGRALLECVVSLVSSSGRVVAVAVAHAPPQPKSRARGRADRREQWWRAGAPSPTFKAMLKQSLRRSKRSLVCPVKLVHLQRMRRERRTLQPRPW